MIKNLIIFLLLLTFPISACADEKVPFANEIKSEIKNYNRATTTLATSGALGEGAVKELSKKEFATIIDLRTEREGTASEKSAVETSKMTYINIPVTGDGISDEQLANFTKVYEIAKKPILLHCGSGNRVGAMLTRYYLSKGMEKDLAFERGRTAGMKPTLEKTIK